MNGTHKIRDCKFARLMATEICNLWKVLTSDTANISSSFCDKEFLAVHQYLKSSTALGSNAIYLKLIIYAKNALKSWSHSFLSSCLQQLKIPKI